MGLPCHDGEVEGVVVEDDAVLVLGIRSCTRYAQAHVPKPFMVLCFSENEHNISEIMCDIMKDV